MLNTSNKLPATQTQAALNAANAQSIRALEENFAAVSGPSRPTLMGSMRSKVSTFIKGMFTNKHSSEDRQEAALLSSSVATTDVGAVQGGAGAVSTKAPNVAIASIGAMRTTAAVAPAAAATTAATCAPTAVGGCGSKRMYTLESVLSQSARSAHSEEATETVTATVVDLDAEPSLLHTQPRSVGYALSFDEYMQESRDYIHEIRTSKIWHACGGGDLYSSVPALPNKSKEQAVSLPVLAGGVRATNSSGAGAEDANAGQVGCAQAGAVEAMPGNYPQMYQEVTTATGQSYVAPVFSLPVMSSTDNSVIGQRMIRPQFISYTGRYRAYQVLSDAQICALNISKVDIIKRMLAGDASSKEMACFLDPMILAMTRVCNVLPASETNHDNGPCGLVEHNLKTAIYSLNSFLRFDPQQATGVVNTKVSMNNGRWVTKKTPAKATEAKAQDDAAAIASDGWDGSSDDADEIIGDCETVDEMELAAVDDDEDDAVDGEDATAPTEGADTNAATGADGSAAGSAAAGAADGASASASAAAKGNKRGRRKSTAHSNPLFAYEEQDKKYGDIEVEDVSEDIWMRLNPYNYATNTGKRRVFGNTKMRGSDEAGASANASAAGAKAANGVGADGIAYEDLMAMGQGASLELDKESAPPASLASAVAALAAETLLEADEDLIIPDESVVSEVVATGESPFKDWNGSEDDEPPTKAKAAAKGKAGAKSKASAKDKAAALSAEARRKQAELKKTLRVRLDTMSDDGLGLLGLNTRNLRIKSHLDKVDSADISLFFENNYLPNINVKQLIKEHNEAKELAAKQAAELAAKQAADAAAKDAAELAAQQAAETAAEATASKAAAVAQRETEEATTASATTAAASAAVAAATNASMSATDEADDGVTDAALRAQSLESLAQSEASKDSSESGYKSLIDLAAFHPISLGAQSSEAKQVDSEQGDEGDASTASHDSAAQHSAELDANTASASMEMESAKSADSSVMNDSTAPSTVADATATAKAFDTTVTSAVEQSEGIKEEESDASDKAKAKAEVNAVAVDNETAECSESIAQSAVEASESEATAIEQSASIDAATQVPATATVVSNEANECACTAVAADAADEVPASVIGESDATATVASVAVAHEDSGEPKVVAKEAEQSVELEITAKSEEADTAVVATSLAKPEAKDDANSEAGHEAVDSTTADAASTAEASAANEAVADGAARAVTEAVADGAASDVTEAAKSGTKRAKAKSKTMGKSIATAAVAKSKESANEEIATENKAQSALAQEPSVVAAVSQSDATTELSAVGADVSATNEAVVDAPAEDESVAIATQSVEQSSDEQPQAKRRSALSKSRKRKKALDKEPLYEDVASIATAQAATATKPEALESSANEAAKTEADAIAVTAVDAAVAAAAAVADDVSKDETAQAVTVADVSFANADKDEAVSDASVASDEEGADEAVVADAAIPANEVASASASADSGAESAEADAVAADKSDEAQGDKSKGQGTSTSARPQSSKSKKASKKNRKTAHKGSGKKGKAVSAQSPVELGPDGQPIKRGPGRPKGSKSQKTLERERLEAIALLLIEKKPEEAEAMIAKVTPKPKPNAAAKAAQQGEDSQPVKRGPGRPKGSKSQKTLERERIDALIGALAKFPKKAKTLAAQCRRAEADVIASAVVNSEAEVDKAQAQEDLKA